MVAGLSVPVASDRVQVFQARLETLVMRHETQASSERLFGLPVTEYRELRLIERELRLLRRLYDLYNDVTVTIRGYLDIRWQDVNIETIRDELREFHNRFHAVYFNLLAC